MQDARALSQPDPDHTEEPLEQKAPAADAPDPAADPAAEVARAAPLGPQAKIAMAALALLALVAVFWPRGESSFETGAGYVLDDGGRPITLASRMAPVTLVHFWATWCAPCITEIPALQQLASDFADEPDFDLLMIAVDDEIGSVGPFLGNLAPMALYDPKWDVAHRYGTRKLPETYLVVGGQVVEVPSQKEQLRLTGARLDGKTPRWVGQTDWGDPEIRGELRRVLDQVGS